MNGGSVNRLEIGAVICDVEGIVGVVFGERDDFAANDSRRNVVNDFQLFAAVVDYYSCIRRALKGDVV